MITSLALYTASRAVTDDALRLLEAVLPLELADRVALWKPASPELVVPSVRVVTDLAALKDVDTPVIFSETIDDANLAEHWVKNDIPYALIWAPPGLAAEDVTERTCHEMEMINDPMCDRYDRAGWSIEDSDALEGVERWRDLPAGAPASRARVCAFCGPGWFDLDGASAGPLDNVGVCKTQHEVPPGGYGRKIVDGRLVQQPPGIRLPSRKLGPHARGSKREARLARDAMPETLRDTLQTGAPRVRV